jgi:hypothetical protein
MWWILMERNKRLLEKPKQGFMIVDNDTNAFINRTHGRRYGYISWQFNPLYETCLLS